MCVCVREKGSIVTYIQCIINSCRAQKILNAAWDEENERETGMSRQILCIKNLKKPGDDVIEESCLLQKKRQWVLLNIVITIRYKLLRISHIMHLSSLSEPKFLDIVIFKLEI